MSNRVSITRQPSRYKKISSKKQGSKKPIIKKENSGSSGKSKITKEHWEKILKDPSSKNLLKKVWSSKNPKQEYKETIKKIASKLK
jgi:hypothetical protein